MVRRRLDEAAQAMGGRLLAGEAGDAGRREFDGAALDSRALAPGQLFFALPGERTDGHRFVAAAAGRGAAAAVVERDDVDSGGAPLLRVQRTFEALHALTRHVRRQVPERLAAVTGSTGKTTTKELLAALLARRFRTAKSPGNLNNLYGFPLSLLNAPDGSEWMVAEMGMSEPGELGEVSRLGRPDVVVLTNVRPAHLEFFTSLEEIAEAKAEILEGLAPGGVVVANAADPRVVGIARRWQAKGGRVVWYAVEGANEAGAPAPEPDLLASRLRPREGGVPGTRFLLEHRGEAGEAAARTANVVEVELPLHGRYNVENFLAASAAAVVAGMGLEEIAAAAPGLAPASGRGEVHRLAGGVTVVDDSYNSNPWALARALEGAAELPARRRWAVLGDMLELGPEAGRFHREAGREAARRGFSPVAGVGELARGLAAAAGEEGAAGRWFATAAEAAEWAEGELRAGDLVLVKGSRGIGLEAVVAALVAGRRPEDWDGAPGAGEGGG